MLLNDLATLRVEVRPIARAILSTNPVCPDGGITPPNRSQLLFDRTNRPLPRSVSVIMPYEDYYFYRRFPVGHAQ